VINGSLDVSGLGTFLGQVDLSGNKIINLSNGTSAQDAVAYSQLQAVEDELSGNLSDNYVPYTGATKNVDLGAHNFSVNTNTLFIDSANHRVGIGTTTPQNKLNVVGDGNFTGNLYSNGAQVLTSYSETDPLWTANQSSYYTKTNIDDFSLSHWTDDLGDRGYTHLSNFTDNLGNRGYTSLSNFTDDIGVSADWDSISDVPTATPASGDTTHLSLSSQIYDWVIGLNYVANAITSLVQDTSPQLGGNLDANAHDIQMDTNNKVCLDGATCSHYITYNGSATIIS